MKKGYLSGLCVFVALSAPINVSSSSNNCTWPSGISGLDGTYNFGGSSSTVTINAYSGASIPYGAILTLTSQTNWYRSKMICLEAQKWGGTVITSASQITSTITTCSWPGSITASVTMRSVDNGITWTTVGPLTTADTFNEGDWIRLVCTSGEYQQSICLSGVWAPSPSCTPTFQYPSVVGFWPFTNSTMYNDISHSGTHLTASGSTAVYQLTGPTGIVNTSVITGTTLSDYLSSTGNIDPTANEWTVAFWAKISANGPFFYIPFLNNPLKTFNIRFLNGDVYVDLPAQQSATSFTCAGGSWHHYIISYKVGCYVSAYCDLAPVSVSQPSVDGTLYGNYGAQSIYVGYSTWPSPAATEVKMSGLLFMKTGVAGYSDGASLVNFHQKKVIALSPSTDAPLCQSITGNCIPKIINTLCLHVGEYVSSGNWLFRGAARVADEGLAIQLAPLLPTQYGIIWNRAAKLMSGSDWRAEITFRGDQGQGVFAVFFAVVDPNANGQHQFNIVASSFVGIAIWVHLELSTLYVLASDTPSKVAGWSTDSMISNAYPIGLHSTQPPSDLFIEKIGNNIRLMIKTTDIGSYDYGSYGITNVPELSTANIELSFGIGAFTRSTITSRTIAPQVVAANIYELINPLSTTTTSTTTTATPSTTTTTTTTTTQAPSTAPTSTPTTITSTATIMSTAALASTEVSTVTITTSPTTTTTTTSTIAATTSAVYFAECSSNLSYTADIVLPSNKKVSSSGAWDPDLDNPASDTYQALAMLMAEKISKLYDDFDGKVTIKKFTRGSIVSDYVVALRSLTQLTEDQIKIAVAQKLNSLKSSSEVNGGLNWGSVQNVTITSFVQKSSPPSNDKANNSPVRLESLFLMAVATALVAASQILN